MAVIAGIGIVVNTGTAMLFMRGRKSDINIRGAFLHMAADALVSLGVVVAGLRLSRPGPCGSTRSPASLIIAVIAWGTWGLLRDSVKMGLQAVPPGISEHKVRCYLASLPGVSAVHDLHIWPMSTTETALTAHLVMPEGHPGDDFLRDVANELRHDHRIGHTTLQIERDFDCAAGC